jgi:hypothetical protein
VEVLEELFGGPEEVETKKSDGHVPNVREVFDVIRGAMVMIVLLTDGMAVETQDLILQKQKKQLVFVSFLE